MSRYPFIVIFLLSLVLPARAEQLDLRACERLAIECNLDLRAQTFDTRASEAAVRREYGLYDPLVTAELIEGKNSERLNLQFFGAKDETEYRRFSLTLVQKLSSGAEIQLQSANRRDDDLVSPKPGINPSYNGELKLSLTQPLLKNFGSTVTEQGILFAVKDREISVQDLRERAFDVLSRVRGAYFDVLRYRDELTYRETSVALAEKVLDENRARVEVGVLAPVEVLEAEVGLKQRQRELLDAERTYRDSLDVLAVLVNAPGPVEVDSEVLGQPAIETDEEIGFRSALMKRPDVLRRIREIERLVLERKIVRNRTLPALDLSASYSHKGLGGEYDDALDDIASDDFENWEVGLNLSYPIGNREARNDVLRTRLLLKSSHAQLAQLRAEVSREIRAAIRLLEVNAKKIEVAARGRDLAEEKLRTLLKRKEVGLATTRDVLEGEEDLALARTDQIASLADYNNALSDYLRVTGGLLEHEGIHLVGPLDAEGDRALLDMLQE